MKQVKTLILAGILTCTLSLGARGGEMGTPGISDPPPPPPPLGEIGTPGAPESAPNANPANTNTQPGSDTTNELMLEIAQALIRII